MLTRTAATLANGALTLALAGALALAPPAQGASRVSVTNDRGTSVADTGRATTFTLRGSGFQSIEGGFGGVYVAFGWVRDPSGGTWRPSEGGITGRDYRYVPDSESGSNAGYLRFVAFPGSSTEAEAQAVLSPAGAFTVALTVPGPVFDAVDRDGNTVAVDCRTVTCGVITFGAHGLKNARNETFTPVRFGDVYDDDDTTATPTEETGQDAATTGESRVPTDTTPDEESSSTGAGTTTPTARRARPRVVTERDTAVAGRALAFTGSGFAPGEQVLAVLDDGVVALGPLAAGASGEVAGVMALPVELSAGTHRLRLLGAASDARASERFAVRAGAIAASDRGTANVEDDTATSTLALAFVGVSALALLASLVLLVVRLRGRGRRTHVAVARTGATA